MCNRLHFRKVMINKQHFSSEKELTIVTARFKACLMDFHSTLTIEKSFFPLPFPGRIDNVYCANDYTELCLIHIFEPIYYGEGNHT
jgi:hypothetical protein